MCGPPLLTVAFAPAPAPGQARLARPWLSLGQAEACNGLRSTATRQTAKGGRRCSQVGGKTQRVQAGVVWRGMERRQTRERQHSTAQRGQPDGVSTLKFGANRTTLQSPSSEAHLPSESALCPLPSSLCALSAVRCPLLPACAWPRLALTVRPLLPAAILHTPFVRSLPVSRALVEGCASASWAAAMRPTGCWPK